MSRSPFVTLRGWFTLAVLCLVFRSPSCDCPAPRRDVSARRLVVKRVPPPPLPALRPTLPTLRPNALPALRPNALAALPKANTGKGKLVEHRLPVRDRFHQRPYSAVSRIRCPVQYAMSRGLPYGQPIPECSSRLERLAGSVHPASWRFGSHLLPPLPPSGTTQLPPTSTTNANTPRSPTTGHSWRKGTVLVDGKRGHGSRLWLRDEVLGYLADSRVARFAYGLWNSAKLALGAAAVWLWTCGDLVRDLGILGLLVLLSALVAWSSGSNDADSSLGPVSVDVSTLAIGPVSVPVPGLLTPVPAGVLASLLFSDLRSTLKELVLSRPRLMIEWRPATGQDMSSETPETPPTARPRPRPTVRPGHSVYHPPALQAELTEERRIERSEAQRHVLEQVEHEAQESAAEAAPLEDAEGSSSEPHKKKTRRAGRKVKERRERWRAREQALAEMEESEGA